MKTKFRSLEQVGYSEKSKTENWETVTTKTYTYDMTSVMQHELEISWKQAMLSPGGILLGLVYGIGGGAICGALLSALPGAIAALMDHEFADTFWPVFYVLGGLLILGGIPTFAYEEGEKYLMLKHVEKERGKGKKWKIVKEDNWASFIKGLENQPNQN